MKEKPNKVKTLEDNIPETTNLEEDIFAAFATVDQLNAEARARANNDTIIINSVSLLSSDYEAYKLITNDILDSKQDSSHDDLNTINKTVVGAINEVKSNSDKQNIIITKNKTDIDEIKTDYVKGSDLGNQLDIKQNKTDNGLNTTIKTIVGSINEVKSNSDKQTTAIEQNTTNISENTKNIQQNTTNINQNTTNITKNTSDINEIKTDYVKGSDLGNQLNIKQNKTDNELNTTTKTVVGAINEVKSNSDKQTTAIEQNTTNISENTKNIQQNTTNINQNTTNITKNTSDINEIKTDYVKGSDLGNQLDIKQNKTDNGLNTTTKTVVGAINEIKSNSDKQTTAIEQNTINISENTKNIQQNTTNINQNTTNITKNTSDINEIKTDYVKGSDLGNQLDIKQNKTDNALNTTIKTVVGAINEIKSINDTQTTDIEYIKENYLESADVEAKQDKTDNGLNTTTKTVVGAINEVKSNSDKQTTAIELNTTNISENTKNIQQNTTNINQNTTNITKNTSDINEIKTDYVKGSDLGNQLDIKQNKTDNALNTTIKTVVGAINEIKSNSDKQTTAIEQNTTNISENTKNIQQNTTNINQNTTNINQNTVNINQNTNDINQIKTDYVKGSDLGNQLDIKQNKTDNALNTTIKTVVGAINEIKSINDTQTTDIEYIKENYLESADVEAKQDKTDNGLNTTTKTVVGAINEVKSNSDKQTTAIEQNTTNISENTKNIQQNTTNINQNTTNITKNTSDINEIKTDYVKGSDLGNQLDIKQNKTDNGLNTTTKTVVGAINEVKSINDTQTTDIEYIKENYLESVDVEAKQDKTDYGLKTTTKTVVGAINEIKSNSDKQTTAIEQNTTNITKNTSDINEIKTDYVKGSELTSRIKQNRDDIDSIKEDYIEGSKLTESIEQNKNDINTIKEDHIKGSDLISQINSKQDKTDDGLKTTTKTVVGAINEVKSNSDKQTTAIEQNTKNIQQNTTNINQNTTNITKNTSDINEIKTDYVKGSDLGNQLDIKQNKTDNALNTTIKTVVGAINEIKSINDTQTTDIEYIKENYLESADVEAKQDKTDNGLNTTIKTVVGAINEIKTSSDKQIANIIQNTKDLVEIKLNYVNSSDVNNMISIKQDKTDYGLKTTTKTVVGAINEVKSNSDKQTTAIEQNIKNIQQNTSKISQNTSDIEYIKENYLESADVEAKQDKTDDGLNTTIKTVVGAINEIKTSSDKQIANIVQNTKDLAEIKLDYVNSSDVNNMISIKQDKTDDGLKTTIKTVVGAINEVKSNSDKQTTAIEQNTKNIQQNTSKISQNTSEIEYIKENYLESADVEAKQDRADSGLNTTIKTVVGAINEIKTSSDKQIANIVQNTKDLAEIKLDYVNSSDVNNMISIKQDKTDDGLKTTIKTVVGAINEVKSNSDKQTTAIEQNTTNINQNTVNINQNTTNINQNSNDINQIKTDYVKSSDLGNQLDIKQDKTDNGLNTTTKTVVGAINELNTSKVNDIDFTSFQESVLQYQNITNNSLNNKQDKTDANLTTVDITIVGAINEVKSNSDKQTTTIEQNTSNITKNTSDIEYIKENYLESADVEAKQDKTDNGLNTTTKTVVGAINEIKSNSDKQTTAIEQNTSDINQIKTDYVKGSELTSRIKQNRDDIDSIKEDYIEGSKLTESIEQNKNDINTIKEDHIKGSDLISQINSKQDKTDNGLNTTTKTVVGAINELNTSKVNDIDFTSFQESVLQYQNITNNSLNNKQDKTDANLTTVDITIVGAINEVKSNSDKQTTTIEQNTTNINQNTVNINQNTNDINQIKTDYVKGSDLGNQLDIKQNKTDNALNTTIKTVVGAINEIKSINDAQTSDIEYIKENYLESVDVEAKQDKTDNGLNTTIKTVVGAINEVKSNSDKQTTTIEQNTSNITKNTSDIEYIKENYLESADVEAKQDKTDNGLNTTIKTVVGAINEVKSNSDKQTTTIEQNTSNITKNTSDIEYIKENYLESADVEAKQDKTDNGLNTTTKTVVGAINEIKSNSDKQTTTIEQNTTNISENTKNIQQNTTNINQNTTNINQNTVNINQNTNDINQIKTDYVKGSDLGNQLDIKQNKTDNALNTTIKTVVGAINEIKSINDTQTSDIEYIKENYLESADVEAKQDKTDNGLNTTTKTVVGAINEIKSNSDKQTTTIEQNTTNISENTKNIQQNTTNINQNTTNINQNTVNINQNTNDINQIKTDYVKGSDLGNQLDIKQNKTDNALNTTIKTVVGAINEIKSINDTQTSDIEYIKENYLESVDVEAKQDKTDNGLNTTTKTVVGAINEIKSNSDKQTTAIEQNTTNINQNTVNINQNTNDINQIKTDYVKGSDLGNQLDIKQNKTDNALNTTTKTVVGAINEIKSNSDKQTTTIEQNTSNITKNTSDIEYIKENYLESADVEAKQDKTDNGLNTTTKTVVGAINEIKSNSDKQTTAIEQNTTNISENTKNIQQNTTNINQNTTNINQNTVNINQNTNDINQIKTDYVKGSDLGNQLDIKQNKTDNALNTTIKTVVGAINEIKSINDTQTSDIEYIKENYLESVDVEAKQDKTDNGLNTTTKTVVGAINEVKSNSDKQTTAIEQNTTNINQNTVNINQNTNDINQIKTDYVKGSDLGNQLDIKQNKTDNALNTTTKTVVGAINEIKSNSDKQTTAIEQNTTNISENTKNIQQNTTNINQNTTNINQNTVNINQNTNDINQIKTDYVKGSDLGNQLDIKQNKTDNALNTTIKTVVGAINEIKSINDTQTSDIEYIKENYLESVDVEAKQDKTDNGLNTTTKTVVGAINEVKSNSDKQTTAIEQNTTNINQNTVNINQNTNDINQIKTDYVKGSDLGNQLDIKQNKTDNALNTTTKTVVGAINEIKSNSDKQTTTIEQNTSNITKNTSDIEYIKENYLESANVEAKQDKTDNGLNTTTKTVVGAINEIKSNSDKQTTAIEQNTSNISENTKNIQQNTTNINQNTTNINQNTVNINQNTNDINQIKTDYVKGSDLGNQLDIKQNKTDNALNTTIKTVVGAINEIKSINDTQTTDIEYIKENYLESVDVEAKQDKTDNGLNTTTKTVVGAINEVKSNSDKQTTAIEQNTTNISENTKNIQQNTTNINQNTTNINQNTVNINQNTNDINQIKTDYVKGSDLGNQLDIKQNKTDNALNTTIKTVVGAINEVKSNSDKQTTAIEQNTTNINQNTVNINQNTNDINQIKTDYVKGSDLGNQLDIKQNKTDNALNTTIKTVVGAINEIKSNSDKQTTAIEQNTTNINQNTTNITKNTSDINEIKTDYVKGSDLGNQLDIKQNKTDNALNTTIKTVVGAINEVKSNSDKQTTAIEQNTKDLTDIKSDYVKSSEVNEKQNVTDDNLGTEDLTIVGAINEINAKKVNYDDFSIFQESVIQYETITNNSLESKQTKTDKGLTTNNKTIVGAINEIKTNISRWTNVGFSQSSRFFKYDLANNQKYRVSFHWNSVDDTTSKIYKEFIWTGTDMPLETYFDGFNETNPGLGNANIIQLTATNTGITIHDKAGSSKVGRIISLEERF